MPRVLIVLGICGVGKTALTIQFALDEYIDNADTTVEDAYRKLCLIDSEIALLEIVDTAGAKVYRTIRDQIIREGDGFLLVYSVTWRDSFEEISTLYQQILRIKHQDSIPAIVVASKSDNEYKREVSMKEGSDLAKRLGCKFFETSAKERINVDEVFAELVRQIRVYDPKPKEWWEDVAHAALTRERADKEMVNAPPGGIISRILKGWTGRYDEKHRQEVAIRAKDEEAKAEVEKEANRDREEIERMKRDAERMAADFDAKQSRLESRITELRMDNDRHVMELEALRYQVVQARKEVETLQLEHKREIELLIGKTEAAEQRTRQLEEECSARELAEVRYHEDLSALQQQILRVEAEKKWIEREYDADVRAERERVLALDAELQRQEKVKEEAEQARLLEDERRRARLQDAIGSALQEVNNLISEQERREREATFASYAQVEAQALLLEKQSQVLQHEKERCQKRILEETERVRRTLAEAHSKREQETQAHQKADEAYVRQLEEQQRLRLEEERRRLSFLEDYAHGHEEDNVAGREQRSRVRESEMLKRARETAVAKLEEECRQTELREESFKNLLEAEVARVRKRREQELADKERQVVEAQCAARLFRALAHEAQEKARLAEERKRKRVSGEELAVLQRRIAEAEDHRRRVERRQVLNCALAALEKLQSLYTLTDMKSLGAGSSCLIVALGPVPVESGD